MEMPQNSEKIKYVSPLRLLARLATNKVEVKWLEICCGMRCDIFSFFV